MYATSLLFLTQLLLYKRATKLGSRIAMDFDRFT